MHSAWRYLFLIAVLLPVTPAFVRAQGTGRSMDIDTSIRAAGMGGSSAGVTWGDPNVWGNVATLGSVSGVRWESGNTHLVPGLANDVSFDSDRLIVGAGGIAICTMGMPTGMGGLLLDYGSSNQTDSNGNVLGQFSAFERVRGRGIALSLGRLADDLHALRGEPQRAFSAFDLSLGVFEKHTLIDLAPASMFGVAQGTTWDWGVQGRVSPLELLSRGAGTGTEPRDRFLLDIGYGYSVLNANDENFVFLNEDVSSPPTRARRSGVAIRGGVMVPVHGTGLGARLLAGFSPLLSLGYARDHDDLDAGGTGEGRYWVDHSGFEVTLANVLTLRRGHWSDPLGEIDGNTTGWGIGVPLGPWAGMRWNRATIPQAMNSGLPDVTRTGWTAWIDPVRLVSDLRSHSPSNEAAR